MRRWWPELAIIALSLTLAVVAAVMTSPTADEAKHILDGISLGQRGHGVHEELVAARLHAMLLPDGLRIPDLDALAPEGPLPCDRLFDDNPQLAEALKLRARLPTVVVWAGLLLLVAAWAARLLASREARLGALAAVALNPGLIAHASLATEDLMLAAASVAAGFAVWSFARRPRVEVALLTGLALGACLLCKISGVFVVLAALGLLAAWLLRERAVRLRRRLGLVGLTLLVALVMLHAAYGFRGIGVTLAEVAPRSPALAAVASGSLGHVPLPVPGELVRAYDYSLADVGRRELLGPASYLMGETYRGHRWSYFPLTLLFKVPLVILLGALLGLRRRPAWPLAVVPGTFVLANILWNPFDIGVRYLLPVLPYLGLLAGFALPAPRRWLTPLLAGGLALGTVVSAPDFIADFNAIAWVVPRERLLRDSNLDWGQANHLVAADLAAHPAPHVCLGLLGPTGLARSESGLRPCRYYLSKSVAIFGAGPIIVPALGTPLRTLGGVIDVYEVRGPGDVALAGVDTWEVSDGFWASELPPERPAFHRVHGELGRIELGGPELAQPWCVLVRPVDPPRSLLLATPARFLLRGELIGDVRPPGGLWPYARVDLPERLEAMVCAPAGDRWFQALAIPVH